MNEASLKTAGRTVNYKKKSFWRVMWQSASKFKCIFTDPEISLLKIHTNNQTSAQRYSARTFY